MGSPTVWLPTALYTALIRMQLNDFTAQECVIAVFGDKIERLSQQRRYGLIYRNLNKLVGMGLLNRRSVGNKCPRPNYSKTAMFDEVTFQEYLLDPEIPVTQVEQKAVVEVRNEGGVVAQIRQQVMTSPAPGDRYTRGFLTGRPRVFSLFMALTYAMTSPTWPL